MMDNGFLLFDDHGNLLESKEDLEVLLVSTTNQRYYEDEDKIVHKQSLRDK